MIKKPHYKITHDGTIFQWKGFTWQKQGNIKTHEFYDGRFQRIKNSDRSGWYRYNDHYDANGYNDRYNGNGYNDHYNGNEYNDHYDGNGYCDNPARGY
jgi:hypothetical protein